MLLISLSNVWATTSRITYAQWTAKWWQWVVSIPEQENPGNDRIGENCVLKQEGPVWFLVGTFENIQKADRACTIPAEKAILIPIINSEKSYLEFPELKTEEELRARAKDAIDRVTSFIATIDGVMLKNLEDYRVQSPLFDVSFPENNIYKVQAATTQAISDGYWIILKPLHSGKHEIRFGGEARCQKDALEFRTYVTYHLTLK